MKLHPDCEPAWKRGLTDYPRAEHVRDCDKCQEWNRQEDRQSIDPDVLKRMVELAPGWSIRSTEYALVFGTGDSMAGLWSRFDPAFQPVLDALAAELVRLVDATHTHFVSSHDQSTAIYLCGRSTAHGPIAEATGDDRTANTINAIDQFHRENPGVLGND